MPRKIKFCNILGSSVQQPFFSGQSVSDDAACSDEMFLNLVNKLQTLSQVGKERKDYQFVSRVILYHFQWVDLEVGSLVTSPHPQGINLRVIASTQLLINGPSGKILLFLASVKND